ncbi:MAG: peroxidase [Anaerolineae bacterium]|nr:peroxidase [Anaerolineae bacterium]
MHHGGALRRLTDEAFAEQIKADYTQASLDPADRAMLDYVAKLTRAPATVTAADVQALRDAGFDDHAILDIAQITGYFAFINRTADGLGVQLEDFWSETV